MGKSPQKYEIIWGPQPGPQTALLACPIFEVFFGGARGGGKTDGMLGEWVSHQDAYGGACVGLMVRRELTQLIETIERSKQLYNQLGAKFHEQEKLWRFPNGSRLRFAYLERDADADAYQGHSYTRVYVEEIGTFPSPAPILKLMATLRSGSGVPCGFRATGNPGGPGHQWVRARYIDPAPLGWKTITESFQNPWTKETVTRDRVYIPSKLQDNRYLGTEYVANLQMVGNAQLVRAWLEGDWSVIEGAFFPEFSEAKHVIAPFTIPESWLRFRSADWGSARPFSIGWWAVNSDDFEIKQRQAGFSAGLNRNDHQGHDPTGSKSFGGATSGGQTNSDGGAIGVFSRTIPRGALIRYREWYGSASPNVGLKIPAEDVADGIVSRETHEPRDIEGKAAITYGVIDPAAYASDGGPSIAERMARRGVFFRRADNARVSQKGALGGWDQLRARLVGDGERPMIYFFSTCIDSIRTLPALQHDKNRPEDVDCFVAGTMIATPDGVRSIEYIEVGDFVETPIGPRRVIGSYYSGMSETIKIDLIGGLSSSGWSIEGTPDHKLYVEGEGLIALKDIKCYATLKLRNVAWQSRGLLIAAWFIHGMRAVGIIIQTAQSLPLAAQSLPLAARACIAKFGLMRDWKFLMASISTTSTAISTITPSVTLSVFRLESTLGGIAGSDSQSFKNSLKHGVPVWTAKGRSVLMQGKCWLTLRDDNLRAAIVEASLKLDTLRSFIARLSVPILPVASRLKRLAQYVAKNFGLEGIKLAKPRPVRIVAVGHSAELKRVYNLTVADAHLFYANDILSSNSEGEDHAPDEIRYSCMSRPYIKQIDKRPQDKILSVGAGNQVSLDDLWDAQPRQRRERV